MLKDIQYIRYLGYNSVTYSYNYEYQIIDDDFEWSGIGEGADSGEYGGSDVGTGAYASAVINCYSEKKLPIAPNLAKAMFIFNKQYGWSIENQIYWSKKFCSNWYLVEKDIEKYLILL